MAGHWEYYWGTNPDTGARVKLKRWVEDKPASATKAAQNAVSNKAAKEAAARAAAAAAAANKSKAAKDALRRTAMLRQRAMARAALAASRRLAYENLKKRQSAMVRAGGYVKDRQDDKKPMAPHAVDNRAVASAAAAATKASQDATTARHQAQVNNDYAQRYRAWKRVKVMSEWKNDKSNAQLAEEEIRQELLLAARNGTAPSKYLDALSEKYEVYAKSVYEKYAAAVAKHNALLDKAKAKPTQANIDAYNKFFRSNNFRNMQKEFVRLFGNGKNPLKDGTYNDFYSRGQQIGEIQNKWWKDQTQATLNSNLHQLQMARTPGQPPTDEEKVIQKTLDAFDGKTSLVQDGVDENGRPKYRPRTLEEELEHQQALLIMERQRLATEAGAAAKERKAMLLREGLVDYDGVAVDRREAPIIDQSLETIKNKYGGERPNIKTPDQLQDFANNIVNDWVAKNPAPAYPKSQSDRGAHIKYQQDLHNWEALRESYRKQVYAVYGMTPPEWFNQIMQLPGISHALTLLSVPNAAIGTAGRIVFKKTSGMSGEFVVDIGMLPTHVKKQMGLDGPLAGALDLAAVVDPFGGTKAAKQVLLQNWLATDEGKLWYKIEYEKYKIKTGQQDAAFSEGFYGPDGDVVQNFLMDPGAVTQSLVTYGAEPTSSASTNLMFQLLADPTNAIPLKATTYLARGAYALEATQGVSKVKKLWQVPVAFTEVDELTLEARKFFKTHKEELAAKGLTPEEIVQELNERTLGMTKKAEFDKAVDEFLRDKGFSKVLISQAQTFNLSEYFINKIAVERGRTYLTQADELNAAAAKEAKRLADDQVKAAQKAKAEEIKIQEGLEARAKAADAERIRLREERSAQEAVLRGRPPKKAAEPVVAAKPKPVRKPKAKPVPEAKPAPPEPVRNPAADGPTDNRIAVQEHRRLTRRIRPLRVEERFTSADAYWATDRLGNRIPKTFVRKSGFMDAGDYSRLESAAAKGDKDAVRQLQNLSRMERNRFRMGEEDIPASGGKRSSVYSPTSYDIAEAGGITSKEAYENLLRDRAIIRTLTRQAEANAAELKKGRRIPENAAQEDLRLRSYVAELDPKTGKRRTISTVYDDPNYVSAETNSNMYDGLTSEYEWDHTADALTIGNDILLARDGSARGLHGLYQRFTHDATKRYLNNGTPSANLLWADIASPDWVTQRMRLTDFGRLVKRFNEYGGEIEGGAAAFRDGGQLFFEIFHQLRLDKKWKKLRQLSDYMTQVLIDDTTNIFAWQWKIMEERAGFEYAMHFDELHAGFKDAAEVWNLHPELALSMIPNGYYPRPVSYQFGLSYKLRQLWDNQSELFHYAPKKYSDKVAREEVSKIFRGVEAGTEPTRVVHYTAERYGDFFYGGNVNVRMRDEMMLSAVKGVGLDNIARLIIKHRKGLDPEFIRGLARNQVSLNEIVARDFKVFMDKSSTYGGAYSKGVEHYRDAVDLAYLAGDIPGIPAKAHTLIFLAHMQTNPDAWLGHLRAYLGYMEKIGPEALNEAKDITRVLLPDDIAKATSQRSAFINGKEAVFSPAATGRQSLFQQYGLVPEDARLLAYGDARAEQRALLDSDEAIQKERDLWLQEGTANEQRAHVGTVDLEGTVENVTSIAKTLTRLEEAAALISDPLSKESKLAAKNIARAQGVLEGTVHAFWNRAMEHAPSGYDNLTTTAFKDAYDEIAKVLKETPGGQKILDDLQNELGEIRLGQHAENSVEPLAWREAELGRQLDILSTKRLDEASKYIGATPAQKGAITRKLNKIDAEIAPLKAELEKLATAKGQLTPAQQKKLGRYRVNYEAQTKLEAELNAIDNRPQKPVQGPPKPAEAPKAKAPKKAAPAGHPLVGAENLPKVNPWQYGASTSTERRVRQPGSTSDLFETTVAAPLAKLITAGESIDSVVAAVRNLTEHADLAEALATLARLRSHVDVTAFENALDYAIAKAGLSRWRPRIGDEFTGDTLRSVKVISVELPGKSNLYVQEVLSDALVDSDGVIVSPAHIHAGPTPANPAAQASAPAPTPVQASPVNPGVTAPQAVVDNTYDHIYNMTETQWLRFEKDRANRVLRNPKSTTIRKEAARKRLRQIQLAEYSIAIEKGRATYIHYTERVRFQQRVTKLYKDDVKELVAPKMVSPYAITYTDALVEQARTYWTQLKTAAAGPVASGVKGIRHGGKTLDFIPKKVWDEVEAKVAQYIHEARGYTADIATRSPHKKGTNKKSSKTLTPYRDMDQLVLDAKFRALEDYARETGTKITIAAYDEARRVLWRGHVGHLNNTRLITLARELASTSGADLEKLFLDLRKQDAAAEGEKQLGKLAYGEMFGHSPEDILAELAARYGDDDQLKRFSAQLTPFQRKTLEEHVKDISGLDKLDERMTPFLQSANMPPIRNRGAARDFLVRTGKWSPRKQEAFVRGAKGWNIDEEAELWRVQYGEAPAWADREVLESADVNAIFDDELLFREQNQEWGIFNRNAEVQLIISGKTWEDITKAVLEGNTELAVGARRQLELQRKYYIERFGDLVSKNGTDLDRMPWLMYPDELEKYIATRSAGTMPPGIVQSVDELEELSGIIRAEVDRLWGKYFEDPLNQEPLTYHDMFKMASEIQANLLANPKWARRTQDVIGTSLDAWSWFNRWLVFSNPAFLVTNSVDAPLKSGWYQFTRRGFIGYANDVPQSVLDAANALTPASVGEDLTTSMYRQKQASAVSRIKNPRGFTRMERAIDRALALVDSPAQFNTHVAGRVEGSMRMDLARKLYPSAWKMATEAGFKGEAADAAARLFVSKQIDVMWPSVGDGAIEKLWNRFVPFSSYSIRNKVLFINEAISHPFVLNYANHIGAAIKEVNQQNWEENHPPGVAMPEYEYFRVELPWAPGHYIDLGTFSDASRGLSPIFDQNKPGTIIDYMSHWIRIVNPGVQGMALGWMNAFNIGKKTHYIPLYNDEGYPTGEYEEVQIGWMEPWSGEQANLGSGFWLAEAIQSGMEYNKDGFTSGETMLLLGQTMLFGAITTYSKGAVYMSYYMALQQKDPEAAAKWLLETEEGKAVQDYMIAAKNKPREVIDRLKDIERMGKDTAPWFHDQSPGDQKKIRDARTQIKAIRDSFGDELSTMTPGTAEYKRLKALMYKAINDVYLSEPLLIMSETFGKSPADFAKQLQEWQVDRATDAFMELSEQRPKRDDYKTAKSYNAAIAEWETSKETFLQAYPQVKEQLAGGVLAVASVKEQIEKDWDAILDRIAKRGEEIEAAKEILDEAKKDSKEAKDAQFALSILYAQNSADYSLLERDYAVRYFEEGDFNDLKDKFGPPTLKDNAVARVRVFLDFDRTLYEKAVREGRGAEFLAERAYNDKLSEIVLKAKGGTPLGEMDPGKFVDGILAADKKFQARYEKDHPGKIAKYKKNAAYIAAISVWGKLARARNWDAANKAWDRLPQWVKDQYYANNPEKARRAQRTTEYLGYMQRWVKLFDGPGGTAAAMKYFQSLPDWAKERYYAKHQDKRAKFELNAAMGQLLRDYYAGDPKYRADYLLKHPELQKWLAKNSNGKQGERAAIMAAYQSIPKTEAWLRKVFRERYPEIFSVEAAGEQKLKRVYDTLSSHPSLTADFEKWVESIWATYIEMLKHPIRPQSSYFQVERKHPARDYVKSLSAAQASK